MNGRDYRFVDAARFRAMIRAGEFIEHAEVHGNMYGTLRAPMEEALARGEVFLLEIDVQGALQLRALREPGLFGRRRIDDDQRHGFGVISGVDPGTCLGSNRRRDR